jgi:hypothetical protein
LLFLVFWHSFERLQAGLQDAYAGIFRFITKKTFKKPNLGVSDESGFSGNSAAVVF